MKHIGVIVLVAATMTACLATEPDPKVLVPVSAAAHDSAIGAYLLEMEATKSGTCGLVRGKLFGSVSSDVNGFRVSLTSGEKSWSTRTGPDGRFTLRVDSVGTMTLRIHREVRDSMLLIGVDPAMEHIMMVELRSESQMGRVLTHSSGCYDRPPG